MTRRPVPDQDGALAAQLAWLRTAVHDRHVDVRLVLEGILDLVEALATRRGSKQ